MSLNPLSLLYGALADVKNTLYEAKVIKAEQVDVPVISIGNITTGGTGKTPFTHYLLRCLKKMGKSCGIVSRGYGRRTQGVLEVDLASGGPKEFGDEPAMLKHSAPEYPVFVAEKRVAGARALLAKYPGTQAILLDDGFQHRAIHRNLNIVLLDVSQPLKHYKLLPSGHMRESLSGLKRAHIVVLTKVNEKNSETYAWLKQQIGSMGLENKVVETEFLIKKFLGPTSENIDVQQEKFIAVCAIGHPEVFDQMLIKSGISLSDKAYYEDHHHFSTADVEKLSKKMKENNCRYFITTAKDAVKLKEFPELSGKMVVADLELSIVSGENYINEELRRVFA